MSIAVRRAGESRFANAQSHPDLFSIAAQASTKRMFSVGRGECDHIKEESFDSSRFVFIFSTSLPSALSQ